jgi:hypothetical protein
MITVTFNSLRNVSDLTSVNGRNLREMDWKAIASGSSRPFPAAVPAYSQHLSEMPRSFCNVLHFFDDMVNAREYDNWTWFQPDDRYMTGLAVRAHH